MRYIVDTNVPIVANGTNTEASPNCRLKAIDFLEQMMSKGRLVIDLAGEIEHEYASNLKFGQPGVGNRFLQAFLTAASKRVERIELAKRKDGDFVDFPSTPDLKKFDPSDRKFAALARKSRAHIANAVDSDWLDYKVPLEKNGIVVDFLCGGNKSSWFT